MSPSFLEEEFEDIVGAHELSIVSHVAIFSGFHCDLVYYKTQKLRKCRFIEDLLNITT